MKRDDPPGLISRELFAVQGDDIAIVREMWDVTVPGCPVLVWRAGTWPPEPVPGLKIVGREFTMRLAEWRQLEHAIAKSP